MSCRYSAIGDRPLVVKGHSVATNGAPALLSKSRLTGRATRWQVSWLAGRCLTVPAFPGRVKTPQWSMERRLSAYSCGDSAGLEKRTGFPFTPLHDNGHHLPHVLLPAMPRRKGEGAGGGKTGCPADPGNPSDVPRKPSQTHQKSIPRMALMPLSNGWRTALTSEIRSAMASSSGLASRPVTMTLVRGERACKPATTSATSR